MNPLLAAKLIQVSVAFNHSGTSVQSDGTALKGRSFLPQLEDTVSRLCLGGAQQPFLQPKDWEREEKKGFLLSWSIVTMGEKCHEGLVQQGTAPAQQQPAQAEGCPGAAVAAVAPAHSGDLLCETFSGGWCTLPQLLRTARQQEHTCFGRPRCWRCSVPRLPLRSSKEKTIPPPRRRWLLASSPGSLSQFHQKEIKHKVEQEIPGKDPEQSVTS
ncbi:uncharacterized protein [Anas platyrhynchos]|uniref:uncharacterized protein isoform X2 n=1 Tax=Anas platyrhynchos TaxID=8839 RepID=UPI003AF2B741